ncbi:MAG: sulfotransferase family 2 domain-containing protein [Chlamydiae bacterium]|nr:sulfotransferase family 2 domain-containing protein [Chlamydiota bacterium]
MDSDFENTFKVTILRPPIERYLSALRYRRRNIARFHGWDLPSLHEHELQHPKSDLDLHLMPNAMCLYLASNPDLKGRELFENAKQTLDSFDCVLFLENFEEDLEDLCQRTGIHLEKQAAPHLNATTPEEVDKEFIEILKAYNDLDLELYEYAKTHLKPKNTTYQFHSPFLTSRKVKQVDYEFSMALNGSGWCYRENVDRFSPEFPIYRWVMDRPANIFFSFAQNQDYTFDFYAQPLTSEILPRVLINGTEIEVKKRRNSSFSKFRCRVPKELISEKPTEITFFSPKFYKYNEIYPEAIDDRKLSFAVNRIKIFPAKRL